MKRVLLLALTAVVATAPSPALAKKPPVMSALQIQQMQIRDYDLPKSVSFPAVISILQDSGYRVQEADKDTGLITASASTKSKMTWMPFVGFGRSKKTPVVTAFIEDRGNGSRVRLTFVMAKAKNGAYGSSWSDEEPILDNAVYTDAFERIDKEMFTRAALAAPAPAPKAIVSTPVGNITAAVAPVASASTPDGK